MPEVEGLEIREDREDRGCEPAGRLADKLKRLPDQPGVYLMKNAAGEIIYVGKAASLRNRVRSYFQSSRGHSPKVQVLVDNIADFEYIVVDSPVEALILESNLIKEHSPWYNVKLKDDKHYPYLRISTEELFPRLSIVRRVKKDGARYFGPFTDSQAVRETIALLRRFFTIRTCKMEIDEKSRVRPCLEYHIKRCDAPCAGLIDPVHYRKMVEQVLLFLEGRQDDLLPQIAREMEAAAEKLEFERAAVLRDKMRALEKVIEKQKIVSPRLEDQDALAYALDEGLDLACLQVFFVRRGKLVGREHFLMENVGGVSRLEIMTAFVKQYYSDATYIPKEILLAEPVEEPEHLEEWLSRLKGGRVHLRVPRRGERVRLLEMVAKNAEMTLAETAARRDLERKRTEGALAELQRWLNLPAPPLRIEAFDISNTQGTESVASMVVFENGRPKSSDYRRFRIKTVEGPNDFASMNEVIRRRFLRGLKEREDAAAFQAEDETAVGKFSRFPDLVLIDGGKGQLNAALAAMKELGVGDIPAAGLAKEFEQLFIEGRNEPIELPRGSAALFLLQRVRDEAHRFAITFHREMRGKRTVASFLDEVPGVGPKRKKALLKHFGSVRKIKEASLDELLSVPGMTRQAAEAILDHVQQTR